MLSLPEDRRGRLLVPDLQVLTYERPSSLVNN